ncbi:hypothetical protein DFR60_10877 [Hungatella effluvii]|uniref:Glycosyl hydrolase family 2 n=1 Tax=Hungatella effluvii TaxID=1096246 RepID=A0A2V3Y379_9FIRM|nr:hypothetical protein [Hungatella effluvii]PXX51992.1 hypothetical protein DFR60_10877 [Hungatella effluvii]
MIYSLNGIWQAKLNDGTVHSMSLPGTLDENKIGYPDRGDRQWHPDAGLGNAEAAFDPQAQIRTRFTRKYTYEGAVSISKRMTYQPPKGARVFLEAERARWLTLLIDGVKIPHFTMPSLSTPHVFEITGRLNGDNEVTLISDNSYPDMPHDSIVYSSAATDETQTNWNGILGYFRLCVKEQVFCSSVRIYPKGRTVTVIVEICAGVPYDGEVTLESAALKKPASKAVSLTEGISVVVFDELPVAEEVQLWDEYEGNLYQMTAKLTGLEAKTVTFGVRDFGSDGGGRLAVNGRTIFLRSEANCAVFPETGYPPMSEAEWLDILKQYQSYGVNCVRFHSYCPPEAAFAAADRLGMMMQPELSHWNPETAFESEESFYYYRQEMRQILLNMANHPSFVMMTFGNELQAGDLGHTRMRKLLAEAHELDATRLYAEGSNVHYGRHEMELDSDFYTSQRYSSDVLRGTYAGQDKENPRLGGYVNNRYPDARMNYNAAMECIRSVYDRPVFSFEVGQFEVLPDFDELKDFKGITDPVNLRIVQESVEKLGLTGEWKRYVEASGELARIGYREEIEAAMRTEKLSGISLLGLQDFPGQGTALVGMMNSHLRPKAFPFAAPKAFKSFFCDQLPLVLLPKYTYEAGEQLVADVMVANYGKRDITGPVIYELKGTGVSLGGTLPGRICPVGRLTKAGTLEISTDTIDFAVRLDLIVRIGDISNTYRVWVYPPSMPVCPPGIYETRVFDQKTEAVLKKGGKVYLAPPSSKENLPFSIQAQFTTDFWSVGTFSVQEGGMGQLIDADHPLFANFPTETHTNWQWWPMASQRAIIFKEPVKAMITEMDSYAYMRPMAQLLECRCGNGSLILSSMGLQDLQQYPEARALLGAIYQYMDSELFKPEQELEAAMIRELVR